MDVEPAPRTGSSPPSHSHAHDGICSCPTPIPSRARSRQIPFRHVRTARVGAGREGGKSCRTRLHLATGWNPALSSASPALCARTAARARCHRARPVCGSAESLSPLSATGTLSGAWNPDLEAAPRQCRFPAHRQHRSITRAIASRSSSSSDPLGRLESVPDPARVAPPPAHTNRHGHVRPRRFAARTRRHQPAHPTTTGALALELGSTTSSQCPFPVPAFRPDSPLRHSTGLCDVAGFGESVRVCERHEARRRGDRGVSSYSLHRETGQLSCFQHGPRRFPPVLSVSLAKAFLAHETTARILNGQEKGHSLLDEQQACLA